MPTLSNARHERFAQELAEGETADRAYELAGFTRNRGNAARLKANESIRQRVNELLEAAGERVEITKSRIIEELGRLGFADIRRVVKWYSQTNVAQIDGDADAQALVDEGEVRFAVANQVEMISSAEIDDDTAAAISEVSMTDKGSLKVKLHDKRAALVDLAKVMGVYTERHEHTGKDGGPIELADADLARMIVFQLTKASEEVPTQH